MILCAAPVAAASKHQRSAPTRSGVFGLYFSIASPTKTPHRSNLEVDFPAFSSFRSIFAVFTPLSAFPPLWLSAYPPDRRGCLAVRFRSFFPCIHVASIPRFAGAPFRPPGSFLFCLRVFASCSSPLAPRSSPLAPRSSLLAPCSLPLAPRSSLLAPRSSLLAPRFPLPASRSSLLAPRSSLPASRFPLPGLRRDGVPGILRFSGRGYGGQEAGYPCALYGVRNITALPRPTMLNINHVLCVDPSSYHPSPKFVPPLTQVRTTPHPSSYHPPPKFVPPPTQARTTPHPSSYHPHPSSQRPTTLPNTYLQKYLLTYIPNHVKYKTAIVTSCHSRELLLPAFSLPPRFLMYFPYTIRFPLLTPPMRSGILSYK